MAGIRGEMEGGREEEIKGKSELQKMFNQYPEGSLERRAVEEEIKKLEGGGGKNVGR